MTWSSDEVVGLQLVNLAILLLVLGSIDSAIAPMWGILWLAAFALAGGAWLIGQETWRQVRGQPRPGGDA